MSKKLEFTDVRCPQCNELVLSHTKNDYLYGSPIKECPFCKAEVVDPFYHEIAIDGIRRNPKDIRKTITGVIIGLLFTAVLAFFNLLAFATENGSVIMLMIMFFALFLTIARIVSFFTDHKKMVKGMERQRKESETRLMDKAYAAKLVELGYKVPDQYR